MKRYHPLILFLVFVVATMWTSVRSYQIEERQIYSDLSQALTQTKAEGPSDWFTTDTIRQFRSHIASPELRRDAQLAFLLSDDGLLRVRGYISYSTMQIWRMSDQRPSWAFALMALVSLLYSLRSWPKKTYVLQQEDKGLESMLRLTPMQEQLMAMFMASPHGELTIREICDALWPGKPDASETLYTLIRRTKRVLEDSSPYRIESNRGRSYLLKKI